MSEEKMRAAFDGWWRKQPKNPAVPISHFQTWQAACAHKDAEFAKEREQLHETANKWLAKCDELDAERDQLRALIAMQAEALKQSTECLHDIATGQGGWAYEEVISQSQDVMRSSAESVAAWKSEKLEPLRREVAVLVRWITEWRKDNLSDSQLCEAISNFSQATAEAYERELKAKVLEDYATVMREAGHGQIAIDIEYRASEIRKGV